MLVSWGKNQGGRGGRGLSPAGGEGIVLGPGFFRQGDGSERGGLGEAFGTLGKGGEEKPAKSQGGERGVKGNVSPKVAKKKPLQGFFFGGCEKPGQPGEGLGVWKQIRGLENQGVRGKRPGSTNKKEQGEREASPKVKKKEVHSEGCAASRKNPVKGNI